MQFFKQSDKQSHIANIPTLLRPGSHSLPGNCSIVRTSLRSGKMLSVTVQSATLAHAATCKKGSRWHNSVAMRSVA